MPARMQRRRPPGVGYQFAVHVNDARIRQGLNKTELAAEAKIGRNTLDNLGYGVQPPTEATVTALATVLGIDLDTAYREAGLYLPDVPADASAEIIAKIEASAAYTEAQKSLIIGVIRTIDQTNAPSRHGAYGTVDDPFGGTAG